MRVLPNVPRLRTRVFWKCVTWALAITVRRPDFRICHVSIQHNHVHLIVEADDRRALSRGMQGFTISCAKQLNARLGRRGRVFADRYHATPLRNPTQTRAAVVYVLDNWRKHREDRASRARLDAYASGAMFPGWPNAPPVARVRDLRFPVAYPTTWLLAIGWRRGGVRGLASRTGALR